MFLLIFQYTQYFFAFVLALDGANRHAGDEVFLNEGINQNDRCHRYDNAGHFDTLREGRDIVLLQFIGDHGLASGLDDAA